MITIMKTTDVDEIYYDHDERKISGNTGKTYTFEEAERIIKSGGTVAYNIAYERLRKLDGDMEAVDKFYRENP